MAIPALRLLNQDNGISRVKVAANQKSGFKNQAV
jgi:hypothetical protein